MKRLLRRPKPFADEGFAGYLGRLSEANGYEGPKEFLKACLGVETTSARFPTYDFFQQIDFESLSALCGIEAAVLRRLASHDFSPGGEDCSVPAKEMTLPPRLVRYSYGSKICPKCLASLGYTRKAWEIIPYTACPTHWNALVDTCPRCQTPLTWLRPNLKYCADCGQNLATVKAKPLGPGDLLVSKHIESLLAVSMSGVKPAREHPLGPPFELGFKSFVFALESMRHSIKYPRIGARPWLEGWAPCGKFHDEYKRAVATLMDWPNAFEKHLLDDCSQVALRSPRKLENYPLASHTLLNMIYGGHAEGLQFMRKAFESYFEKRFGLLIKHKSNVKLLTTLLTRADYLTDEAAAKRTGFTLKQLDEVSASGAIESFRRVGETYFTITSLDSFVAAFNRSLSVEGAMKKLSLERDHVLRLVKTGLLTFADLGTDADVCRNRVSKSSIAALMRNLSIASRGWGKPDWDDCIGFNEAMEMFEGSEHSGICSFVRGILAKRLPVLPVNADDGFGDVWFDRNLVQSSLAACKGLMVTGISTAYASLILDVTQESVLHLVREGFLKTMPPVEGTGLGTRIRYKSLVGFREKYVFSSTIAKEGKLSRVKVIDLLDSKGIAPVSGPRIDDGGQYLYRRADVESLVEANG